MDGLSAIAFSNKLFIRAAKSVSSLSLLPSLLHVKHFHPLASIRAFAIVVFPIPGGGYLIVEG